MKTNFYIDNNQVQPPENFKELEIQLNFDKEKVERQVSVNNWRWVRQNAQSIEAYIKAGLTGGVGVFEGLPFKIELEHKGNIQLLSDGYIDLADETDISCNDLTVTTKEKQGIDWLNETADSVSFERMFEDGEFSSADFVFVPYVISTVPNYREAFMALVSGVFVVVQLNDQIRIVTNDLLHVSNPFEATFIATLVIDILYLILLLIILIQLIISFILYIVQQIKYHAGMFVKRQFEIGCAHFGLTFKSTIFDNANWAKSFIIPEKFELEETSDKFSLLGGAGSASAGIKGFLSPNLNKQRGYFKGTFGDFIRQMKIVFHAKVVLKNGEFIFERRDFNTSTSLYQVADLRNDFYKLNTGDIKSNTLIEFQHDINDKNTIDKYTGTNYQVTIQPKVIKDKGMVLLKNFERVSISFALAKRKEVLTVPEKILSAITTAINVPLNILTQTIKAAVSLINGIIKFINKMIKALAVVGIKISFQLPPLPAFNPPKLLPPVNDRIGMLMLENDFVDQPKLLLLDKGLTPRTTKIIPNNEVYLTAKTLWDEFHFIDSFVPINGQHGQYKIYDFKNVPFCFADYLKVKDDNKIIAPNGSVAELISLKWNPYGGKADITFKVNELYTNNLQLKTSEPDGN